METVSQIARRLLRSRFFAGAPVDALERLVRNGELAHAPAGETIIEEGEYEMICYVILSGEFEVAVTDQDTGARRVVRRVGPGELLGEMAVLSGAPRLAEVTCVKEASLLRIGRGELLAFLDSAPEVKKRIDEGYRERALRAALKAVDVFAPIDAPTIASLAKKVELNVHQKGEIIFAEDDRADAFYLIRDGFVKLSRRIEKDESAFFDSRFDKAPLNPLRERRTGEFIMAYLGRGFYFGERALIDNRPRHATASALTRVELVKLEKKDFNSLLFWYPEVAARVRAIARTRYAGAGAPESPRQQDMLQWMASQDILAADAVLVLDLDLCVRCLNCIDACAKLHGGVTRITHNGVRHNNILVPTSCRHCREPTCMIGCPTGAIQRDRHGEVYHTEACIGCGNCARRCPFGNISIVELGGAGSARTLADRLKNWMGVRPSAPAGADGASRSDVKRKAVKCDLCMGFDYLGCQHNCPTGAVRSVKPSFYLKEAAGQKR